MYTGALAHPSRCHADSCWKQPLNNPCDDAVLQSDPASGSTGEMLPVAGSPFTLRLLPGPEDPASFTFTGFQSEVAAGARPLPLITIRQFDRFGNRMWGTAIVGALEVVATPQDAPAGVAARTFRVSAGPDGSDEWTIPIDFTWAGIWSYDVQWSGVSMSGWPRQVTVTPGAADPAASTASGYAVAGHFVDGQEVSDDAARPLNANSEVTVRTKLLACGGEWGAHVAPCALRECVRLDIALFTSMPCAGPPSAAAATAR